MSKPSYYTLNVSLDPYGYISYFVKGDYIALISATGDTSKVSIKTDEGEWIPIESFLPARTVFTRLSFKNDGSSPVTLKLLIGFEYYQGLVARSEVTTRQLPSSPTAAGNLRTALMETTIKQPIDIQDHWTESVVLLPSAARTTSGSSADVDVGRFLYGEICIDVTAVSGTNPVLNVYIDGKDRYTGKYKVLFTHENINTVQTIWDTITMLAFQYLRVRWTISGTSPSFTFSVSMEGKS